MLLDGRALAGQKFAVCIIGGGAAGLTLAARLDRAGLSVLLLEAGGREQSDASQAFYQGEVVDPASHWAIDYYRIRALGGTSRLWGGRAIPYDPIDFAPRDWVPHSGWPIAYDTVARYYPAALEAAEAGAMDYAPSGPIIPGLDSEWLQTTVERFSRPTDFWARYGEQLSASRNVRIVTDAAVTAIRLNAGGDRVDHLDVRIGDETVQICAGDYVLAAGGLETARLLLVSDDVQPGGIGNAGGWLGRGYMCHLAATFGEVQLSGDPRAIGFDYEQDADGVYLRRRLALTEQANRELRVMNFTARLHIAEAQDPAHRSAVLSTIFLAAFAVKYEYSRAMREADRSPRAYLRHLANIARDPLGPVNFARTWGVKRYLAKRRIPSIALYSKHGRYPLEFHSEQAPNRDSRVTLSDARDAHGVRRLRVDWRTTPLDMATVRQSYRLIARELERTGTGRLTFDDGGLEAAVLQAGAYGGHHSGTARMSASPEDGVVDGDCRIHGIANLFVASCAVLPTSSQANPTLTMLALALRLGDHLEARHPAALAPVREEAGMVLVTGASGFVGNAVARRLRADGVAVRAGGRPGGRVAGIAGVDPVACDVLDPASLDAAMVGITAVVHCAVGYGRDTSVITDGTRNVLEAARRAGVSHLIQLSSIAVHDPSDGLVSETSPTASPQGAYGAAKLAAEAVLRAGAGDSLGVTILRPTLIYGPGSAQWTSNFVERMRTGEWHALGAGGEGVANLIHVDDLAGFIAHLLARPAPAEVETYIVNGENPPSWNSYLAALNAALDLPPLLPPRTLGRLAGLVRKGVRVGDLVMRRSPIVPAPWRAIQRYALNLPSGDELARFAATTHYDTTRMRATGYTPKIDLAAGIETIAAYYGA